MTLEPTTEIVFRHGEGTGVAQTAEMAPASWDDIAKGLAAGEAATWLSLRSEDGVHTRPVFAAWTGTSLVHASNPRAVKSRHLDAGSSCSLALQLPGMHLVIEVTPVRLTSQADLERASVAFRDVYDWPTTVAGDLLHAPYAAPTSGGPPFRVYELTPTRAHAFPTEDGFEPTRFVF
ncbi:MAG: hypothetical protein ACRCZD_18305 [Phycicoccus sp.]